MRYIANILTLKKFTDNELYNVVSKKEDLIDGIPTLVVGWDFTKQMYPNANILEWEIGDNVYWTFGSRERKNRFDTNVQKFRELALSKFVKSVKYEFVSVLISSEEEKGKIFSIINGNSESTVYFNRNMAYIHSNGSDEVYGISLTDIEYEGKDKKKFFAKIYSNPQIKVVDIKDELTTETKTSLKNYNYIIPYLYS